MADPNQSLPSGQTRSSGGALFNEPVREPRSFPTTSVGVAIAAVLVIVAVLVLMGRRHGSGVESPDTLRPVAAYASNLKLTGIAMSESTSFSGGKSTFLDGHISNTGPATVSGITMQVLFAPEGGGAPQLETVPVNLVRTRQPYLDTQPVSAAPLAPGAGADFRLIFEGIRPEWNQQTPEIHVVDVVTK